MVYQIYCAVCIETGLCLGMGLHTEIVVLVQIWFMAAIYKRIDMIDTKIFSIYKISIQHCQIKIKICPVILFSCVGEADCIILNYATQFKNGQFNIEPLFYTVIFMNSHIDIDFLIFFFCLVNTSFVIKAVRCCLSVAIIPGLSVHLSAGKQQQ